MDDIREGPKFAHYEQKIEEIRTASRAAGVTTGARHTSARKVTALCFLIQKLMHLQTDISDFISRPVSRVHGNFEETLAQDANVSRNLRLRLKSLQSLK
jgi:hypothetical protein